MAKVLIDNAMDMVFEAMPADTDALIADYQERALQDLAAHGVTSVHDAGISAQELRGFDALLASDRMPIRVYAMLDVLDEGNDATLAAGPRAELWCAPEVPRKDASLRSAKVLTGQAAPPWASEFRWITVGPLGSFSEMAPRA